MSIGSRIKELRKNHLKMSQTEFGKRLGVSIDVIANIEHERLARPEQKEPLMKLISKEFSVNYDWLMTGKGEMFDESQEDFFDKLAEQYGLGSYARKILEFYGSLDDEHKETLENFIYQAAKCVLEDSIAKAQSGIVDVISTAQKPELVGAAAAVFDEAFKYSGFGNIESNNEESAVDKTISIYRAADSQEHTEHEIIKDGKETIDKLNQIPPVTKKEDF